MCQLQAANERIDRLLVFGGGISIANRTPVTGESSSTIRVSILTMLKATAKASGSRSTSYKITQQLKGGIAAGSIDEPRDLESSEQV